MDTGEIFNQGCGGPGSAGCDCDACEKWRRYCYSNHDHGDGRPKQFLLVASDDKDNLCIPREVTSQLTNMIPDSEHIKLETPDGRTYSVKFVNSFEFIKLVLIILTTGWRDFVDANQIQQGDPMLFVYCGNSTFKVRVFNSSGRDKLLSSAQPPSDHHALNAKVLVLDPSASEKTSRFAMGNSSNAREVREDPVEIVDKEPPPPAVIDQSSDDDAVMGEGTSKSCRRQKRVPGYAAHKTHGRASVNLEVGVRPSQRPYFLPLDVTLHPQVEKKVEQKLQSILSELPIFVRVITISSVDRGGSTACCLVFCKEYISASLRGRTGTIFLQLEGGERKWRTTLSVRGDTTKSIASGWKEFARDNHLEVGDVCLFQMQKGIPQSNTMTVYLIRKSEIEP